MFFTALAIHLLAATIWTGGHLILSLLILPRALQARDPQILLDFEQGYEKIGMPALILQIATGLWLAFQHLPDVRDWLDHSDQTAQAIMVKLILLAMTALFALNARFRVIPRLSAQTLPLMAFHIRSVTLLSVLFVLCGLWLRTGGI